MDIVTKMGRVFDASNSCPGCGSVLGMKMLLQSMEDTKGVVIVTSPGEVANIGKSLHVSVVNSRNPAATARGLAAAMPEAKIIVYSGDAYTAASLPALLGSKENILYICYNNTCYYDSGFRLKEFVKSVAHRTSYAATANVAYYEDFVAKLNKAFARHGTRFIDLLSPCPVLWGFDPSNTVEMGRMATEALLWPLYEVTGSVSVTKIPPQTETVHRYFEILKTNPPQEEVQALQESVSKKWRTLREGKLL